MGLILFCIKPCAYVIHPGNTFGWFRVGDTRYGVLDSSLISQMTECDNLDSQTNSPRGCTKVCPAATTGRYVYIIQQSADLKVYEIEIFGGSQEGKCNCKLIWSDAIGLLPDT